MENESPDVPKEFRVYEDHETIEISCNELINQLLEFAHAYHVSQQKDLGNDSAEWGYDYFRSKFNDQKKELAELRAERNTCLAQWKDETDYLKEVNRNVEAERDAIKQLHNEACEIIKERTALNVELAAERDKLKEENERLILDANKDLSTIGDLMQDSAKLKADNERLKEIAYEINSILHAGVDCADTHNRLAKVFSSLKKLI